MNRAFFFNSGLQFEQSSQQPWKPINPTTGGIFPPNWEKSDPYSEFDSALSSISSSPVSDSILLPYGGTNPPLNSSLSQLNLPIMNHFEEENLPKTQNSTSVNPNLPFISDDPGFAERAAKFSCFGCRSFNDRSDQLRFNSSRLSCSAANSNEESSVSEQIPIGEFGIINRKVSNSRKRKGGSTKGVGSKTEKKEEDGIDELKKSKKTEDENGGKMEEKLKADEPPKDYIHVRARRGQATDSHSLAERVRREKIGERMKLLQNLVPNCNKVTGKALMLDEIINYVQSLQRQVEFLSMKLAIINPSLDFDTNDQTSQNVNQSNGHLSYQTSTLYLQNPHEVFKGSALMTQPVNGFDQDDLESIVRMGFGENLDLDSTFFHTIHDQPSMKVELSPQLSTIDAKERQVKYDS